MINQNFRIGIGYDIHKLSEGRKLIVGGVEIPCIKGLLGHSDADVLIHALIDAMLGALSLADIGTLFPDTSDEFKDADSKELLQNVYQKVKDKGYVINNVDCNIIAQKPKMMPYIYEMKKTLSGILNIDIDDISIKAKTKEHLDAVGEEKGIEAQVIVLLVKN